MLRINTYPPKQSGDIELSRTSLQDLDNARSEIYLGQIIRDIGKTAGHQLACIESLGMEQISILASELSIDTVSFDDFDKRDIFLDGVEEGAAVELALRKQAQRPNTH